jgi:hypothetical protein
MRRVLLIFLALVLALVGGSRVCAEDGFYVVPCMKGNYAPVPKTGQTTSYGTRDDGELKMGVTWPTPRFTDNQNGTVTDNLTGLIWMQNANAFSGKNWDEALTIANNLHAGSIPGLTDGSQAGDWRLPNIKELQSLIDYGTEPPPLPPNNPFSVLPSYSYHWSSTTNFDQTDTAWGVYIGFDGTMAPASKTATDSYVWCVRGGR